MRTLLSLRTALVCASFLPACGSAGPTHTNGDDAGSDAGAQHDSGGLADSGASARDAVVMDRAVHDGALTDANEGGAATDSSSGDAGAALPLGSVKVTNPGAACTKFPGAPGATCMDITVSCPSLPDLDASVAILMPSGTPKGTIVGHGGGAGTGFFAGGPEGKGFASAYPAAGYRFVQIAWASDWASGVGSIKGAACRPATAFQWVWDTIHEKSTTTGFCGTGTSGGSAALSYSLTAYGLKSLWDYMLLGAGPAPARIDYGCDPSLYTGPARNLCPELTDAPFTYSPGVQKITDGWEGTKSCGVGASSTELAQFADDSVAFPGGDFDYPKTGMSFWYCTSTPNETTGQGSFLISAVHPKNPTVDVHCYGGSVKPSVCTNEYVFQDPDALSSAVTEMTTDCVPNH